MSHPPSRQPRLRAIEHFLQRDDDLLLYTPDAGSAGRPGSVLYAAGRPLLLSWRALHVYALLVSPGYTPLSEDTFPCVAPYIVGHSPVVAAAWHGDAFCPAAALVCTLDGAACEVGGFVVVAPSPHVPPVLLSFCAEGGFPLEVTTRLTLQVCHGLVIRVPE